MDIIRAGTELMFLYGYNATGIKHITDKINIPKGSFYNHFSSKEEFGLALLDEYSSNGLEYYKNALLRSDAPPIARLKAMFLSMIEGYKDIKDCKLGCIMGNFSQELADVNEKFRVALNEDFNEGESVIVTCLELAKKEGSLKDTVDCSILASFILNSWHGAMVRMKAVGTVKPLEDFISVVFDQLI